MTSVKILISYKNEHKIIKSGILTPIQTGRKIADSFFDGMIGDDTGENISQENLKYNELSAQYWAWKNYGKLGNPDYIGFMHYRRHFLFDEEKKRPQNTWLPNSSWYKFSCMDDDYLEFLEDKKIKKAIEGFDCVVSRPYSYKNYIHKNLVKDFQNLFLQKIEHFNLMFDTIDKLFPEYTHTANEVKNGSIKYLCNMFIMKKNMFDEYCNFLFLIEQTLDSIIDTTNYSESELRFLGFLGEIILTVFILQKKKEGKYKIKEIDTSFIENTEDTKIKPVFSKTDCVLAVSASKEYTPYLSVWLQSVIEHIDVSKNYDIIVLERSISTESKKILKEQVSLKNVSLRFVNPLPFLQKYDLKFSGHYNLECYFRLCAPLILKGYDKVIFTDCDLVFNEDPAKLYDIDISKYPLAACKDLMFGSFLNYPNSDWKHYSQKELELKYPYEYFNTGVMVLNIKKFNENNWSKAILELVSQKQFRILEQDGLNCFFKNSIKYIPTTWNFPVDIKPYISLVSYMPAEFENQYRKDKKNPFIIHWAGNGKPWNDPTETMADIWWQYARKTPFYEEILLRMVHAHQLADNPIGNIITNSNYNRDQKLKYVLMHPLYFLLKKFKYKIKKNLVIGQRKSKAKQKYKNVKALLKDAKKIKKEFKKI